MIEAGRPPGVVVATPNVTHARIAIDWIERGVAVIVEKPIADSLDHAQRICDASAGSGVPAVVGHHRRYNPIGRRARKIVSSGRLGVCATVLCTWLKPDYFSPGDANAAAAWC